jgi:hypothetical protein
MNGNGYDVNQAINNVVGLYKAGRDPRQIIQTLLQNNRQANEILQRLHNMSQGRNPREFVLQLARQNGANEQSLQELAKIFQQQ